MMLRFLFVVVLIGLCHGFFHPVTNSIRTSTTDTNNKPLQMAKSYKEMLEEAKLKKAMKASGAPTTPSMPVSPSVPSTPVPSTPVATNTATTASSSAKKSTGKYQFNDEMYDHMKFVISKLTDKIKSGISLTPQELERFSQSVDAILADATGESQESAVNSRSNYNNEMPTNLKEGQQVGKDGKIFDVFRGGSWKVQNMEKMTTEEYYAALNEKMKEVQAKRRAEGFGKEDSEKYRKSLNRAPNSQ